MNLSIANLLVNKWTYYNSIPKSLDIMVKYMVFIYNFLEMPYHNIQYFGCIEEKYECNWLYE